MLRATILSVVLFLITGPSASLLCGAWCPRVSVASHCHHEEGGSTARLASDDACDGATQTTSTFLKEDLRTGSSHDAAPSVAVETLKLERPVTLRRTAQSLPLTVPKCPLSAPLRI